jgi:hypothetical protein
MLQLVQRIQIGRHEANWGLMLKFLACVPVICGLLLVPNPVAAGCTCVCKDGRVAANCTSPTDIPPICPQRSCPIPSIRQPPPLSGIGRCKDVYVCDQLGRCDWKPGC